jgi:hypothetical protein
MARSEAGGRTKLSHAKGAVLALRDGLTPRDHLAVVVFHTQPATVLPLSKDADFEALAAALAAVGTRGGGTRILAAVIAARKLLAGGDPAAVRRILLLSDGRPEGTNLATADEYDAEARRLKTEGIVLSAVGTADADRQLLERLTGPTGGTYHPVPDPRRFGRAFLGDLVSGTRSFFDVRAQPVQFQGDRPFGVADLGPVPPLGGLVLTARRPGGELLATSDRDAPVLARRRFGFGRVVAFPSDLDADWTDAWRRWDGWSRLLPAILSWLRQPRLDPDLAFIARIEGRRIRLRCDVLGEETGRGPLQVEALRAGAEPPTKVSLEQTAPRRYEAELPAGKPGTVVLHLKEADRPAGRAVVQVGYVPEFRNVGVHAAALRRLAAAGGGSVVSAASDVSPPPGWRTADRHALWPWLLVAAAALVGVEVVLRIVWRV